LTKLGNILGYLLGRRLATMGQCFEYAGTGTGEPRLRVVGDTTLRDHLERLPPLVGRDGVGARDVDCRPQVGRDDEHRASHAEDADERPVAVQRCVEGRWRRVAGTSGRGQVDRRRVRRVVGHDRLRHLDRVGYPCLGGEQVPVRQSGPALEHAYRSRVHGQPIQR